MKRRGGVWPGPLGPMIGGMVSQPAGGPLAIYTSLVEWWSLNEATGQPRVGSHAGIVLEDATGATPQVTPAIQGAGAGARTTGSHHLRSAADNVLATNGESFALSGWFRIVSNTSAKVSRNNNPLAGATDRDFELNLSSTNSNATYLYVRGSLFERNGATVYGIVASVWYWFFAAYEVLDASNARITLRVGNVSQSAMVAVAAPIAVSPRLMVGRRDNASFPAQDNADFDELAYWRGYVPTTAEQDWLYNAGAGRTYADWLAEFA